MEGGRNRAPKALAALASMGIAASCAGIEKGDIRRITEECNQVTARILPFCPSSGALERFQQKGYRGRTYISPEGKFVFIP